ncbi:MAG: acetyl-CoA C-acyltransferase, partial [Gammaproteobacteria bacterium]|nr:acetyl-CoA C-acyltransferase [Gammaproteobacteria bacterium]
MIDAVIVSTARTPIGRAYKGAFNNTKSPTLAAHAIRHAVERSGVAAAEIDDVVLGSVLNAGSASSNIARLASLAAGLPNTVAAQTIDRQCSSGLMAIAIAARQVIVEGMQVVAAGGQENVSEIQNRYFEWSGAAQDDAVTQQAEHAYMPMLLTAEYVAKKYGISRETQDRYALSSQQRTAAAQAAGKFDDEIVPATVTKAIVDKETEGVSYEEVTLSADEGNRPSTTLESLLGLRTAIDGGVITGGNACQLSDGASACIVMNGKLAEQRGLEPLGIYRGVAVAGNAPEEMGIGPVYAIPKLLSRFGLSVADIGLWELNEAFACQTLFCRDSLGIDPDLYNV